MLNNSLYNSNMSVVLGSIGGENVQNKHQHRMAAPTGAASVQHPGLESLNQNLEQSRRSTREDLEDLESTMNSQFLCGQSQRRSLGRICPPDLNAPRRCKVFS